MDIKHNQKKRHTSTKIKHHHELSNLQHLINNIIYTDQLTITDLIYELTDTEKTEIRKVLDILKEQEIKQLDTKHIPQFLTENKIALSVSDFLSFVEILSNVQDLSKPAILTVNQELVQRALDRFHQRSTFLKKTFKHLHESDLKGMNNR